MRRRSQMRFLRNYSYAKRTREASFWMRRLFAKPNQNQGWDDQKTSSGKDFKLKTLQNMSFWKSELKKIERLRINQRIYGRGRRSLSPQVPPGGWDRGSTSPDDDCKFALLSILTYLLTLRVAPQRKKLILNYSQIQQFWIFLP